MSRHDLRGPESIDEIRRLCHGYLPWHRSLTLLSGKSLLDYPEARLVHAAHLPADEALIIVYDGTFFGGADLGLLLTAERLCWKNRGGRAFSLRWDELDPALVGEREDALLLGEATIRLPKELVAGLRALVQEIARRHHAREASPYRDRVVAPDGDSAKLTTDALVTLLWDELGPRPSVHYHPLIPASWLDRVRAQHAQHLQGDAPIAVVFQALGSETIGFALSTDRLYWTLSDGKVHFHGWKNLEPHTIRSSEYGALTVMGVPVVLPVDCPVERMTALFRTLVQNAGGVDLTSPDEER
ncbi:MAG: hypothetical protein ABI193_05570 [Minicystis sp.]